MESNNTELVNGSQELNDDLKSINELVALYYPTPLPILENGAALGEQAINFSIL